MIDSHTHIWSDDPVAYPWGPHDGVAVPKAPFTVGHLIQELDGAGVDQALVIQPRVYGYDHSYLYSAATQYSSRIRLLPLINAVRACNVDELQQHAESTAVAGVRVIALGDAPVAWLNGPEADRVWSHLSELALPVGLLIDPPQLGGVGVLAHRFPDLQIVLDHMGRCHASTLREHVDSLLGLGRYPNIHVKVSALSTRSNDAPPHSDLHPLLSSLFNVFGSRRLIWGTDAPHTLGAGYGVCADSVKAALTGLHKDDAELIFGGNARRVFGF